MSKIFILLAFFFASCNNSSDSSGKNSDSTSKSSPSQWTKEDENEFLANCVDGAKAAYPEDTAYSYCKCVLDKVKQAFPTADSAEAVLKDSISAVPYTKDCH